MRRISTARVAVIILAAGLGRRFGTATSKLLAPIGGVPMVRVTALAALASRAASVTVICGHDHQRVEAALEGLGADAIYNPDFETGLSSSLKAGLARVSDDCDGILIMLGDMPFVASGTLDKIIARFCERSRDGAAVVPVFEGRRGNPALIGRPLFAAVSNLTGDEGARQLLAQPGFAVDQCVVDDRGVITDVDTPTDLRGETIKR